MSEEETTFEKLKGTAKELAGKVTGQDTVRREGEEQQKKAQKEQEAERLEQEATQRRSQAAGHKSQEQRRDR
jgi:uncharacterized protein YjbJ (UPF0337 family)